jgi:hypothetical protein
MENKRGEEMISEIIKNYNMANDHETYWVQLHLDGITYNRKMLHAVSIQIIWDGVTGTLNGIVEVYQTNDQESRSLISSYNVNSSSNKNNSVLDVLSSVSGYMKVKYISNGITGGSLSFNVNYEEVT